MHQKNNVRNISGLWELYHSNLFFKYNGQVRAYRLLQITVVDIDQTRLKISACQKPCV